MKMLNDYLIHSRCKTNDSYGFRLFLSFQILEACSEDDLSAILIDCF